MTSRLTVRIPSTLHRKLKAEATRLGFSLNDYMNRAMEAEASKPAPEMVEVEVEATIRFKVPTRAGTDAVSNYLHQAVSQWRGQCGDGDPMQGLDYRSVEVVRIRSV